MDQNRRIAVVSGGNRGIGLEVCRQLGQNGIHVVLTSRNEAEGQAARDALQREGLPVSYHQLDVTSAASITALSEALRQEYGGLDILVNNAGTSMKGFNQEVARGTLEVNFFGPLHLTDALLPLLREQGRIVMVSSSLGDRSILSEGLRARFSGPMARQELVALMSKFVTDVAAGRHEQEGWPSSAYSVSKIGLNALTQVLARELEQQGNPRGILVNAACPGWVRTRMGGPGAPRSVEEGAGTLVWLALLPPGGPLGGVFRDRQPASW